MNKVWIGLIFLISTFSYGYINVHPSKFDKDITDGCYEVFKLYNKKDRDVKYRIFIEKTDQEWDMSKWVKIYPKSCTVFPLQTECIKVYINPDKDAKDGDYFTKLVIKEVRNLRSKDRDRFLTIFKLNMKGHIRREKK